MEYLAMVFCEHANEAPLGGICRCPVNCGCREHMCAESRVIQLVERRPPASAPWSPVELLEEFLADIKSGKTAHKSLMVFFTQEKDGRLTPETWSANVSHAEAIAYCHLEIQRTLEAWRN